MKFRNDFPFSVGGPSILMIFVILCLTSLGVLSYATANMDYKLSAKNAETVQSYYRLDQMVQLKLEQIDGMLLSAQSDTKKAVDSGTCAGLANSAFYEKSPDLQPVFSSSLPKNEKYAACFRIFSQILLTRSPGIAVKTDPKTSALQGSFTAGGDSGRQVHVTFVINPYGSAERYQVTGEKLETEQYAGESTAGRGAMQLWQGSSQPAA